MKENLTFRIGCIIGFNVGMLVFISFVLFFSMVGF